MTKTGLPLVITAGVRRPRDDARDARSFGRLVRGDREALADLYDAHAGALFRHGLALTRRPFEAEDLVQAVFLKLATTGAALLTVRNPANYMHRILRAEWIDGQRRQVVAHNSTAGADDDCVAQEAAGDVESAIDVQGALAGLPALQREIVQLHLIEGFSFREAGRITGVSMFTAASRYRVALERLRKVMGERHGRR
jgi:RNA polymerase sigma-70 factor, ECF subfamily